MSMESPVSGEKDDKGQMKKESVGWALAASNYTPHSKRQFQYNSMVSTCSLIFSGDFLESKERENHQQYVLDMLSKFVPFVHLGFVLRSQISKECLLMMDNVLCVLIPMKQDGHLHKVSELHSNS